MARYHSAQQDLFSHLVCGHKIFAGKGQGEERITIGRLELRLGLASGVSLMLGRVHALSTIRRRRPIYLLPPCPAVFMDRSPELETLRQSLLPRHVIDLHGLDGAGKSALAAALSRDLDLSHFPDGAAYVAGHFQYPDLLQALFDCFYESDTPVKIELGQTHTYLSNLRALIILDDLGLGPKQIDPVLDALSEAAVLAIGPERIALGRGRPLRLKGLPRQEAVALFRRVAVAKPSAEDSPIVDQICILLNDMPLPITGVAAQAAQSNRTLTQLLTDLQGRKPWAGPGGDLSVGPSLEEVVMALDGVDRQLLTLVAAFVQGGASSEALRRMLSLSTTDFQQRLERLQDLGLTDTVGPTERRAFAPGTADVVPHRLMLVSAYYKTVRSWLVDDAARKAVVDYYAMRLNRGDSLSGDDLPGLLGAIEDSAHNGWHDQLKPLVDAADRSLAQLRWWAEWQHVLDLTRRCAQAAGDRALEAWAVHQLGSVVGALSDFDRGFHLLRTALSMRQALGDETGAALSAHNLEVLERLAPPPIEEETAASPDLTKAREEPEEPAQAPPTEEIPDPLVSGARRNRRLRLRFVLLVAIAISTIAAFALRYATGISPEAEQTPGISVAWEFGDAWNALDRETWTQQIKIVVEGGSGAYEYYVNGESSADMFELVLPLCEGAQGTIRVESGDGQSAEVEFEFDSPYCR